MNNPKLFGNQKFKKLINMNLCALNFIFLCTIFACNMYIVYCSIYV